MNVNRSARMTPQKTSGKTVVATLPKEGMTLLAFLGRGSNARPFYGANQRYLFGGKHHQTGNVLDSDVALFLAMKENGKPLFEVMKVVKTPAPVKEVYVRPVKTMIVENQPPLETIPVVKKVVAKKKVAAKKKPNA
jgi:hypothetical protein